MPLGSSNKARTVYSGWSNWILFASVAGILLLTLYPFRFDLARTPAGGGNPFLLGDSHTPKGAVGSVLNVLLFIPFGFGLSEKLRACGLSRKTTVLLALGSGAAFSYVVEFLQIYIPSRDSGWSDVLTNSAGSVVGFFLFEILGAAILRILSRAEEALRQRES